MLSLILVFAAIAAFALGGLPSCIISPRTSAGRVLAAVFSLAGGLLGLAGLAVFAFGSSLGEAFTLAQGGPASLDLAWVLPWGSFSVALDPLSAVFLAPVFAIPALGSLYGLGYRSDREDRGVRRLLDPFYGILAASMALVLIARDGVLFLIAWEVMAMAAFFAATSEDEGDEVRRAGWVYLIATHIGTLCLFAMFSLWNAETGSFALLPSQGILASGGILFVLAVAGFGFKAGLMPLHVWLPAAHANAPSQVSGVMSGVMLKLGIYGIIRVCSLMPIAPAWWGTTLLVAGAVTGIAGIAFAIGQSDIKRMLAYSSIENIGIIAMGMGLALLGRTNERWDWILLGLGAALFHVWNHALFKSLLFFASGGVVHAAETRDMDALGGIARRAPALAGLFLVASLAICALPPLNGFAGEWLLYLGLFRTLDIGGVGGGIISAPVAAVAAVALALIGSLAVAAFVRLYGAVFLGSPRSGQAEMVHEPRAAMLIPMAILAAACLALGVFPRIALIPIEAAVRSWAPTIPAGASIANIASLWWTAPLGTVLAAIALTMALLTRSFRRRARGAAATRAASTAAPGAISGAPGTWDCGYARPTPRMQYTGSSFGASIVHMLAFVLWPRGGREKAKGFFPASWRHEASVPDAILDRAIMPVVEWGGSYLPRIRVFQRGQTHMYVLYVLIITIALLVFSWMGA